MVKQQELSQRVQSQQPIIPSTGPLKLQHQPPKDLTSSLIESNIKQIKLNTAPPQTNLNSLQTMNNQWTNHNWNNAANNGNNGNFGNFQNAQTGIGQPWSSAKSPTNSTVSGNNNNNHWNHQWNQNNQTSTTHNWSGIENGLLSKNQQKIQMNQMTNNSGAPLLMSTTSSTNNHNNQSKGNNILSSQDIMDFLN